MNCIGVSYKTAPAEIRDAFSMNPERRNGFSKMIRSEVPGVTQCVILSTCNRFEVYFDSEPDSENNRHLLDAAEHLLCRECGVPFSAAIRYFLVFEGNSAICHVCRVACGIDSVLLGEDEILRQLKEAYYEAHDSGATAFEFNTVFQMSISSAKGIKTETGLSEIPVSYGTLTANEVLRFYGGAPDGHKNVLLIGATGKMGTIVANDLTAHSEVTVYGTVRSHHDGAERAVPERIRAIPYEERYSYADWADVIISATSGPHYTVTKDEFDPCILKEKPRLLIDLAVPNDMDAALAHSQNCTLRQIEYFNHQARENNERKRHLAETAEEKAERSAGEIRKELRLHELILQLPALRKALDRDGPDRLIFSLRSLAGETQVNAVADWLQAYLAAENSAGPEEE